MSAYKGRRDFRPGPAAVIISIFVTMLFAAGTTMTYRDRGWNWVSAGLAGMALLSIGGIVETLVLRVRLTDDALLVTDLLGRRQYDVADIAGVCEAKGVPTAIQLADGRWVKLPPVGSSLGNSIRAWLKHFAAGTRAPSSRQVDRG